MDRADYVSSIFFINAQKQEFDSFLLIFIFLLSYDMT
jgi:hypothetical protein